MNNFHLLKRMCYVISHPWAPIIFSFVSIGAIILGLLGIVLNNILLNQLIFGFSLILLLFSILIIIYQSFRIDIIVYPLSMSYFETDNYFGISNEDDTKESTVKFFFIKHSLAKINLKSLKFVYPPVGQLSLVSTSFITELKKIFDKKSQIITSNADLPFDREDFQNGVLECNYQIHDKRYFKKSGDYLTITVYYQIEIFKINLPVYNEKKVLLGYHIE